MTQKIATLALLLFTGGAAFSQNTKTAAVWRDAEAQARLLVKNAREARTKTQVFPRTLEHDSVRLVNSNDWTSGFFPGILWMLQAKTGKAERLDAAKEFTDLMKREPFNGNSHDVGFKVYCSYGQGYRQTKDTAYRRAIIQGAKTLAARFNPTVGCIRSWNFPQWQYPVIIDNMMNLELLFAATRLSGDSSFYHIAVAHANTTLKHHFRADNSCYHVVDYDTLTGAVRSRGTHQGYAHESAWARGQAWALYGYTMCYRETGNKAYLLQAEKVASFILDNPGLPADLVPYWDYNAPDLSSQPRDASAAAITASALYELSGLAKGGKKYRQAADKIMASLTNYYRAATGTAGGFLLLHSTGNKPAGGEVDAPLIYADYYYLEAVQRSRR